MMLIAILMALCSMEGEIICMFGKGGGDLSIDEVVKGFGVLGFVVGDVFAKYRMGEDLFWHG